MRAGPPTSTSPATERVSAFARAAASSSPVSTRPPHVIVASGATSRTSVDVGRELARACRPTRSNRRRAPRSRAPARRDHRPRPDSRRLARARTASCSALMRSSIVPNSSPNASFSARLCESPAPIPAMSRPSLTRCAVRKQLASVAGGRKRGARDQRAHVDPRRLRRDRAEQREALERRPAVGRIAAPEMIEHEHRVEPGGLGRARDRDRDLRILDERRQRQPDAHTHVSSSRASTAAPTAPARSPSSRRHDRDVRPVGRAFDVAHERRLQRIEQQRTELHEPAGDHDQLGVEHVGERREAERRRCRRTRASNAMRVGVAGARRFLHVHAGDRRRSSPPAAARIARAAALRARARAPCARARCPTRSPPSARAHRTRTTVRRARP